MFAPPRFGSNGYGGPSVVGVSLFFSSQAYFMTESIMISRVSAPEANLKFFKILMQYLSDQSCVIIRITNTLGICESFGWGLKKLAAMFSIYQDQYVNYNEMNRQTYKLNFTILNM